jgi:hypothetical protein
MGEYNRIFKPSQTKISFAKIVHAKLVTKAYEGSASILALFRDQV